MVIQVHSRVKKYKNLKQPDHVKKLQMKSIKEIQLEHLLVNNKATVFSGIGFLLYVYYFYGVDMDHIICTIKWGFVTFVTSLVTKNIFLILFPKITKVDIPEMLPMRVKYWPYENKKAFKAGIVVLHNLNGFQIVMRVDFINLFNVTKMDFVGAQQVLEMKYLVLSNILQVR